MAIRQFEAWGAGRLDVPRRVRLARPRCDRAGSLPVVAGRRGGPEFRRPRRLRLQGDREGAREQRQAARCAAPARSVSRLAKNLFLWSGRSWVRKGIEAWYTLLIEALWPKRRILEVYANVAEFGDGIYGAQAAARSYWRKDASAADSVGKRTAGRRAAQSQALRAAQSRPLRAAARALDRAADVRRIGGTGYLRSAGLSACRSAAWRDALPSGPRKEHRAQGALLQGRGGSLRSDRVASATMPS